MRDAFPCIHGEKSEANETILAKVDLYTQFNDAVRVF
jgi:hypothetical protein